MLLCSVTSKIAHIIMTNVILKCVCVYVLPINPLIGQPKVINNFIHCRKKSVKFVAMDGGGLSPPNHNFKIIRHIILNIYSAQIAHLIFLAAHPNTVGPGHNVSLITKGLHNIHTSHAFCSSFLPALNKYIVRWCIDYVY